GFVYSTNNQPNINDNLITSSGEQINVTLTNLDPSTTYYVRSFISNSIGEYYGNEISFTTLPPSSEINYGINEFDVVFDEIPREYIVYIPESYDHSIPSPILFVFHGFGGSNNFTMNSTGFNEIADQENFIVVYPQGSLILNLLAHWNVGGFTAGSNTDDVAFVNYLISSLSEMYNLNLDRVYATGMSNGGFMSFLLACQLSNEIAAIASVTGSMTTQTVDECNAQREVPILQIHGTNDPVVPYNGIQEWNTPIDDVLDFWVINNQCSPNPIVNNLEDINNSNGITVQEIIYNNGLNGSVVKHFKVNGGTHVWFQNEDIDSSALIWEFFSNYDINGLIN
ncbi:MAG: alpha/beta hydrolase family esterase, partial [Flavobacteriaceae bacterium]